MKKQKCYENFMNIELSKQDKEIVYDYFLANYDVFKIKKKDIKSHIYSKIVIIFKVEDDFYDSLDDHYDIKEEACCWNWDEEQLTFILYTESEECYNDCCNEMIDCDCEIYQFIYDQN